MEGGRGEGWGNNRIWREDHTIVKPIHAYGIDVHFLYKFEFLKWAATLGKHKMWNGSFDMVRFFDKKCKHLELLNMHWILDLKSHDSSIV